MVNEVLNGLYQRGPDWKYILQTITLGVIPVGSGNGLARNIQSHLGETLRGNGLVPAVLNVVRGWLDWIFNCFTATTATTFIRCHFLGRRTEMDLFHLEHRPAAARSDVDSSHCLGFLSLGWGIIADIDIDSEHLRSLGELRFAIYALKKIKERRLLKARLSYLKV